MSKVYDLTVESKYIYPKHEVYVTLNINADVMHLSLDDNYAPPGSSSPSEVRLGIVY